MDKHVQEGYRNSLKNKLYGLLCDFEKNNPAWEKLLDSVLTELMGYPEEQRTISYYKIFYKLSTLRYLRYEYFRSAIFDCMALIG